MEGAFGVLGWAWVCAWLAIMDWLYAVGATALWTYPFEMTAPPAG